MMIIRIKKTDGDTITTKINGTVKEIAEYYFQMHDVVEVEFLHGGDFENDYFIKTPLKLYKPRKDEIERFQLSYNVRCIYSIFYKDTKETEEISCGII